MSKARLTAIRAALDATGLRGCDVSPGKPTVVTVPECAGCYEVFGATLPADIGATLAALVRKVTARADAALRALGLPDVVGVRSLAAENTALRAEVARLRAQRDAFRAALTEPAGWPGVDILREALAPPPDAVPEVLDDLARRAGMVLDALAAALAALEAP